MEPRAPYRNKLAAVVGLVLALLCAYVIAWPRGPLKTVLRGDVHLHRAEGYLYYGKRPFTGTVLEYYADGTLAKETPYYHGHEDGMMKSWYLNKQQEQERYFSAGKKQGIHRGWWPGGLPKFEYQFTDDEHNGFAKEWYESGKPARTFHYTNGHEEGLQQLWWDDGTVRANYVVKDGQQYGLIGRKFCRNTIK